LDSKIIACKNWANAIEKIFARTILLVQKFLKFEDEIVVVAEKAGNFEDL